ncbi:MAG: hypothetical protein AB7F99_01400 [Vicinamibacterales bacterium]
MVRIAAGFVRNVQPLFRTETHGTYDVESFEASLVLHDRSGSKATYRKREKVRFTRDNVRLLSQRTWGSGRQFAGHRMTYGRILCHGRVGAEERHSIELVRPGQKGEIRTLSSTRVIRGGFTSAADRWLETDIDHRTRRLSMKVVFPPGIRPRGARVGSLHGTARRLRPRLLLSGGSALSFLVKNPPIGEKYTISWGAM